MRWLVRTLQHCSKRTAREFSDVPGFDETDSEVFRCARLTQSSAAMKTAWKHIV